MTHPNIFLAQSYRNAWEDYTHSLHRRDTAWDYVILTASNFRQAESFRHQIDSRLASGCLPASTHFAVIPDPDGKRVGSGGATLGVIKYIADCESSTDFSGLKILVIHSGGDSKRVPQYSALGKLFSPVPRELPDGRPSTLFDEFIISMSSLPSRIREGMLLLSGDVLLLFNPLQIDYSGNGAAAISFKEDVETGKNHGVYLHGRSGNVARFLHKQTVETLRAAGAVNEHNCVDIDTGAVIFSKEMLSALLPMATKKYINETVRLSLYGDFLYPLAENSTLEMYMKEKPEGEFCPELLEARKELWQVLRPFRLKLLRFAPAKFIHFGTTGEILRLMSDGIKAYEALGWSKQIGSSISDDTAGYCSILDSGAAVGLGCYLENSLVREGSVISNNTLLSDIDINGQTVPSDVVLHGMRLENGKYVARIYGVNDNPKTADTFLNTPFSDFLEQSGIKASELWKNNHGALWTAELYPVCESMDAAVNAALNLYEIANGRGDAESWRSSERTSLCSGFNEADAEYISEHKQRISELVQMNRIYDLIRDGKPAKSILGSMKSLTEVQKGWLKNKLMTADFSMSMRLNYYIGTALGSCEGEQYISEAFRIISDTILNVAFHNLKHNDACKIVTDSLTVRLPLRVNWGGGWSDTPPYCMEHGGTVLNAAIALNGRLPVEVRLEKTDDKKIIFDSRDMDVHGEFETIEPLQNTGDPYDPFALQKAALLVCGIIPEKGGNLKEILERLGGGFIMRSEVTNVPKGSGLGTSSILSGACVKALLDFTGIEYTEDELYSRVLCMEQIMSTGGGWQDQVGGLTGGVKYITSKPGEDQRIKVQHIDISEEALKELNDRFILIYTGQRRLARNLLRDVVCRYIGNEPESVYALNEIQRSAALMRFELERGNIDAFAKLLREHWELSKMLDRGSSNTLIEHIFGSIDDLIDGMLVCGAGGGGFLQAVMKKDTTKEQVRTRLKEVFQDTRVEIWECKICSSRDNY